MTDLVIPLNSRFTGHPETMPLSSHAPRKSLWGKSGAAARYLNAYAAFGRDEVIFREAYGGLEEPGATEPAPEMKGSPADYANLYLHNKALVLAGMKGIPSKARAQERRLDRLRKVKKWKDLKFLPGDYA